MKSDRLLSIVLILKARRRATEAELARELEVSARTVHRDLESLAAAGVPVYSERGRGGGWALVEGYAADLSGLTEPEARALLLLGGPLAAAGGPRLRSAVRKLVSALPEQYRPGLELAGRRMLHDPAPWGRAPAVTEEVPDALEAVEAAVLGGRRLRFRYARPGEGAALRVVDPIGLVAKAGRWYLLAARDGERRTYRVSRIQAPEVLGEAAAPAADIAAEWQSAASGFAAQRGAVKVVVRVAPNWERRLMGVLAARDPRPDPGQQPDAAGRGAYQLAFPGLPAAVGELGGFGGAVEVISPPALRAALAGLGRELQAVYA